MRRFWSSIFVFVIAISLIVPSLASGQESVLDRVKDRRTARLWGVRRFARF